MADLTLRNARNTIENAIVDSLQEAYGVRLSPAAVDAAHLRLMPSDGLANRALRFLTSAGKAYRFARFETAADDGVNYIKPDDVLTSKPGRWVKTTSTVATGYLKRCELYNDDEGNLDTFEQRLFGGMPAVLVSFEGTEHHPKSTEKGALYWTISRFSVFAVETNARAVQTARQGSLRPSEALEHPGTAAILGDVKDLLAGFDLNLNDVAFIEIRNETPVVRDQARQRFVEVLEIEVYATLTHQDPSVYDLAEPYEFNMQLGLADPQDVNTVDFGPDNKVENPLLLSIAISPTSSSIPSGTGIQYTAIGTYEDTSTVDITQIVTWNSSAPTVATVSADGVATTLIVGSTNITATKGTVTSNTASLTST